MHRSVEKGFPPKISIPLGMQPLAIDLSDFSAVICYCRKNVVSLQIFVNKLQTEDGYSE